MCLISIAGKGTDKYSEKFLDALKIAAETNKDGMGYSFKRASNKKVYISKGYNTVEGLIKSLRSHRLKINDELMVHQRIGNKGAKNVDMCHPFVLGDTSEIILQNDKYVTSPTMVHNGTFFSFSKTGSDFSDTFWFVKEFIHRKEFQQLMKNDYDFFKTFFKDKLNANRLCFLFPDEETNLITFGDYKEDDGYLFSNESYKDRTIKNVGGVNSDSGYGGSEDRFLCGPHNSMGRFGNMYGDWDDEFDDDADSFAVEEAALNSRVRNKETNTDYKGTQLQIALGADGKASVALPEDEIIIGGGAVTTACIATDVKYRLYMDMWIPEKHSKLSSQFSCIRWNPTVLNFNELVLYSLTTEEDEGIEIATYYQIVHFDSSSRRGDLEGLHGIRRRYSRGGRDEPILYIPGYRIPQLFEIKPDKKVIPKYVWYYRLCNAFTPSKTLLKKVNKMMDVSKLSRSTTIELKTLKNIPVEAMLMFQLMLTKQQFPNDYLDEINKTNYVAI